ncbi:MAG TPA: nucleolar RNA-binding Nop10p family protein [archaeon]|nr:nucleolar RNA-binding Nop10p family protein [archaeon]
MNYIKKCPCGYTLKEGCNRCGPTKTAHPPKFSIADKYGKYRRKLKSDI